MYELCNTVLKGIKLRKQESRPDEMPKNARGGEGRDEKLTRKKNPKQQYGCWKCKTVQEKVQNLKLRLKR